MDNTQSETIAFPQVEELEAGRVVLEAERAEWFAVTTARRYGGTP
jgi:hypothetical protein